MFIIHTGVTRESFGPGVGPIFLYGVNCDGTENRLVECPTRCYYSYDVNHNQDVGVKCLINTSPGNAWISFIIQIT